MQIKAKLCNILWHAELIHGIFPKCFGMTEISSAQYAGPSE